MFGFAHGVFISFRLSGLLLPACSGSLYPPANGTRLTVLKGSTARISWRYEGVTDILARAWYFQSSDGSREEIIATLPTQPRNSSLPRVNVEEPATLILQNVTEKFNGTYRFILLATSGGESKVVVYIAVRPSVTINCSSPLIVNKGDDVICQCKCEGGNPPAKCTWFKNGTQIGESGMEVKILFLRNFNGQDGGSYTCVCQSHVKARDERSITITDIFKPVNTIIRFSTKRMKVEIGSTLTITCSSEGFPSPRFTIFHNHTKIVSTASTYTVCQVKWNDAGTYECFAKNELGNDSAFASFTIEKPIPTTLPTQSSVKTNIKSSTFRFATSDGSGKTGSEELKCATEWYIIVVSLVSGIIIGILLCYIVLFTRRKWFTRPERTPEVQITAVDSTYQELDLTKINEEEKYQSLRRKDTRNDGVNNDESTYTELNKTRDVDNNYQSLT